MRQDFHRRTLIEEIATAYNRNPIAGMIQIRCLLFEICLCLSDENTGVDKLLLKCDAVIQQLAKQPTEAPEYE